MAENKKVVHEKHRLCKSIVFVDMMNTGGFLISILHGTVILHDTVSFQFFNQQVWYKVGSINSPLQ